MPINILIGSTCQLGWLSLDTRRCLCYTAYEVMFMLNAKDARKISDRHDKKLGEILKKIKAAARYGGGSINVPHLLLSVRFDLVCAGYSVTYVKPPKYVSAGSWYDLYKLENDYYQISW